MPVKKEYSNDDLTIVWKPEKCIHSGVCVKTLPDVYDPKARPWISIGNATTDELIKQVDQCPSGALSYYMNPQSADRDTGRELQEDPEGKMYFFDINGLRPRIEYIRAGDRIFLTHTEVPPELEGKGIGSDLIRKTLEDVGLKGLTLIPLCPFVASYIKRHPEWKKLVLKGVNIK